MTVQVQLADGGYRISGDWEETAKANAFLAHLAVRAFSPATIRAYAFDVVNLARFLTGEGISLASVTPVDVFAWVDWQGARRDGGEKVVALRRRTAAASTVNRRVAAVRAFFEYLVMTGARTDNPVPAPRRGQGLRPAARGLLGHLGPGRPRAGGRLVRQPRRLPESLPAGEVDAFVASLRTRRDRAMALAMLLGGLRSAEVRGLLLCDADLGRRGLRVIGKGGKERHVPVETGRFSRSWPLTCGWNVLPAWPAWSVSWSCAARPQGNLSRRRACAACSAVTGRRRERPGSGRTGSGTPTGPNSPRPALTCWRCGSSWGIRRPRPPHRMCICRWSSSPPSTVRRAPRWPQARDDRREHCPRVCRAGTDE